MTAPHPFITAGWPPKGVYLSRRQGAIHMVGKKRAGRLLDGREWNEFPGTRMTTPAPGGE